ncbi:metabotropic glutamate receptor 1-like [Clytia hemisphaerica]|uniref:metabotropic glutamate receptor 1-like n=1 Tax=Clytia hemisphaerica TaxID=252671 RepID=UPI0034D5040A
MSFMLLSLLQTKFCCYYIELCKKKVSVRNSKVMLSGKILLYLVAVDTLSSVDGLTSRIPMKKLLNSGHNIVNTERFYLVAFVPIRMKRFNRSGFVWREVLKYAYYEMIETFEKEGLYLNLDLLILDSENRLDITTSHIMDVLSKQMRDFHSPCCSAGAFNDHIIGFIGPASSSTSNHVLNLLAFDHYPVISYSATSVRFHDKKEYPNFMRTLPSDDVQVKLILDILLRYNWTYVAVIAQDDEYGRTGMDELKRLFSEHRICTAVERTIAIHNKTLMVKETKEVLKLIQNDLLANVVILWMDGVKLPTFFETAEKIKFYNKTFILSESANETPSILSYDSNIIRGLLSIVPKSGQYNAFEDYFRRMMYRKDAKDDCLLRSFFEESVGIDPTSDASINDYWGDLPMTKNGFVYDSLHAYGQAVKTFVNKHNGTCNHTHTNVCLRSITSNRSDFIQNYLKKVAFINLHNEKVSFDSKGNVNCTQFWISTIQPSTKHEGSLFWKRIGNWSNDQGLEMNFENFTWNNGLTIPPSSKCGARCEPGYEHSNGSTECCWTCIPCQGNTIKQNVGHGLCMTCQPGSYTNKQHTKCVIYLEKRFDFKSSMGIILLSFSITNLIVIISFTIVFIVYRKTPVVLSSQLSISLAQFFFLALLNLIVPLSINKLMGIKCLVYGTLIPIIGTLAILPTVLKTQRLNRIFMAKQRIHHHHYFHTKDLRLSVCLLLAQVFVTAFYSIFNSYDQPVTKVDPETQTFTINCNFNWFIYIQFGFVFTIVLFCGISAFRARVLPHNYNETRMIAYSMFITCVILVFTVPLFVSIGLESQTLILLCALLLVDCNITLCMYSPKVWVIIFRPNLNTTKYFTISRMKHVEESVAREYRKSHLLVSQTSSTENSPSRHSCRSSMLVKTNEPLLK